MNSSSRKANKLKEMWESSNEKWVLNNCCHHIVLEKLPLIYLFIEILQTSNYQKFLFNEGESTWENSCLCYSHCPFPSGNVWR